MQSFTFALNRSMIIQLHRNFQRHIPLFLFFVSQLLVWDNILYAQSILHEASGFSGIVCYANNLHRQTDAISENRGEGQVDIIDVLIIYNSSVKTN